MKGFDSLRGIHIGPAAGSSRKIRGFSTLAFALALALLPCGVECRAAGEYTYTVTFYPGNHGTFGGTGGISVGGMDGSGISVGMEGQAIKVRGLKSGDIVSFDAAMEGAVALEEGGRYYVKGIRLSGRDNNTIDTSAFRVDGDRDYVVAYGIRGDMTSYVVHYQDGAGNTLAESRSYYGNVGDKPVVAFRYIEGYEPRAYNLTKTLVSNEAENVFTFVYSPVPAGNAPGGSGTGGGAAGGGAGDGTSDNAGGETGDTTAGGTGTGGNTAENGGVGDGSQGNNAGENGMAGNGDPGIPAEGEGGAAAGNMANDAEAGGMDENPEENGEETELAEQDVPLDLMELDDEEVPLADKAIAYMEEEGSRMITASVAVAAASAALFVFFAVWLWKRAKRPH